MNNNRDGQMRHTITKGTANYWPNRFSATQPAAKEEGGYVDYPEKVAGIKARAKSKKFKEHFNQAELFYNSMSASEKTHIKAALSFELDHCDDPIVYERVCSRLAAINFELSKEVATMVGSEPPKEGDRKSHGKTAPGLSQMDLLPEKPTIASRMIAIIIADGYDAVAYNAMIAALKAQSALPFTIAPRRTPIFAAGEDRQSGKGVKPDHHLEGMRSTMFDSLFIPGGSQSIETLKKSGRAVHWVREAFGHLKAIGATGEAVQFVRDACQLPGITYSESTDVVDSYGVVTAKDVKPKGFGDVIKIAKGAKDFISAYIYEISMHKNWDRELAGLNAAVPF
jgi:catalase